MKKKVGIGIGIVAALGICLGIFLFSNAGGTAYYGKIDNSRLEQNNTGGGVVSFVGNLEYSYTLRCYDKNGNAKDITFGVSRQLKDGAFICLQTVPIRGVLAWEEVQYDTLPAAMQGKYSAVSLTR